MTEHKIIFGDSRSLNQIKDKSVQLIITSPPYWQLKDYGTEDQIGFNDSYEEYINNLNLVWKECKCTAFFTVLITTNGSSLPEAAKIMKRHWKRQDEKPLKKVAYSLISG